MRLLVMAAAVGMIAACSMNSGDDDGPGVAASGGGTTRSYAVGDFTGVELKGADDVDVRVGTAFSVRAEGPSKELDTLRIVKDGDTLDIGRRSGASFGRSDPVKVFVTLPRLAKAGVGGSGMMTVDRVEGTNFAGSVGGSGNLSIAAMTVDAADLSIAGSGGLMAVGTATALTVNIAGSGDLTAPQLVARRAQVSIAGSGDARAVVDGPAKVNILGSGDVDLGPKAKCEVSKMGSGSVSCGG